MDGLLSAVSVMCVVYFLSSEAVDEEHYMDSYCGRTLYMKKHPVGLRLHQRQEGVRAVPDPAANCTTRLVARVHHRIDISIISLALRGSLPCSTDFLQIMDCQTVGECQGMCCVLPSVTCCQQHNRSATYCGSRIPSSPFTSSSNILTLRFLRDTGRGGNGYQLYITTFHTGRCSETEILCSDGRCIHEALTCSKGNNCYDDDGCADLITAPVIVAFIVGGFIIVIIFSIAIIMLWYYRRYHIDGFRGQNFLYSSTIPRSTMTPHRAVCTNVLHTVLATPPQPALCRSQCTGYTTS